MNSWFHYIAVTVWASLIIYIRDRVPEAISVPQAHLPSIPYMRLFMWFSMFFYSAAFSALSIICDIQFKTTPSGNVDIGLGFSWSAVTHGSLYFAVYGGLLGESFAALWALWVSNSHLGKYKGAFCLILTTLPGLLLVEFTSKGTPNPHMLMISIMVAGCVARGVISLLREAWSLTTGQTVGVSILALEFAGVLGVAVKLWKLSFLSYPQIVALGSILAICTSVPEQEEGPEETHGEDHSQDPLRRPLLPILTSLILCPLVALSCFMFFALPSARFI